MTILDMNVFLRHLTHDDPSKGRACTALFRRLAEGSEEATTTDVILAEIVFVLASPMHYGLSHEDISARLSPLLALRGLKLSRKQMYLRALDVYATHAQLDFEDAVTIAFMHQEGIRELLSYDADFDHIPGVTRVEPTLPKAA